MNTKDEADGLSVDIVRPMVQQVINVTVHIYKAYPELDAGITQ